MKTVAISDLIIYYSRHFLFLRRYLDRALYLDEGEELIFAWEKSVFQAFFLIVMEIHVEDKTLIVGSLTSLQFLFSLEVEDAVWVFFVLLVASFSNQLEIVNCVKLRSWLIVVEVLDAAESGFLVVDGRCFVGVASGADAFNVFFTV